MNRKRISAIAMTALLIGLPIVAGGSEKDEDREARQARPTEQRKVAVEKRRCGEVCLASDIPIYVPPNRGSTPARMGGGSRGGGFRS